jgi:hypothetical protein
MKIGPQKVQRRKINLSMMAQKLKRRRKNKFSQDNERKKSPAFHALGDFL